jgi:type VI secretion system protein ImpH
MAAKGRRADPPVEDSLYEEGYRFDFFQAVRLLERISPFLHPVGREAVPAEEVVRFSSHLTLSFPPSAIREIARAEGGDGPARMSVAFMGLTGPLGVLPRHYTEMLLARSQRKDTTLRDFLDLFNHRLISLFYRAWEKYQFPVAFERAVSRKEGVDWFSHYLFDLIGMGTQGLRGRLDIADVTLLFYAGLLAQHPRSASALKGILSDYFMIPVEVTQFIGQWLSLADGNRSCLGPRPGNNALGLTAVAGSRVWDQQAKFTLRLGPLTYPQFCQFLPSGTAFCQLVSLARFYAGQEYDFDVQLILKAQGVPCCRLGRTGELSPRLGWSTWLTTGEFADDAEDALFVGDVAYYEALPSVGAREQERGAA